MRDTIPCIARYAALDATNPLLVEGLSLAHAERRQQGNGRSSAEPQERIKAVGWAILGIPWGTVCRLVGLIALAVVLEQCHARVAWVDVQQNGSRD